MSTELNASLHFLGLTQEEQQSFYPSPAPMLWKFDTGFRLYKWTDYTLVNPKTGKISSYWSPWYGFRIGNREIPGFKELRMRYRNLDGGVGRPQEFARARNAVTEQWNGMNSILHAELLLPVWGFVGLAGGQRAYNDRKQPAVRDNVFFIGGDAQLCIPNLTPAHIKKIG